MREGGSDAHGISGHCCIWGICLRGSQSGGSRTQRVVHVGSGSSPCIESSHGDPDGRIFLVGSSVG